MAKQNGQLEEYRQKRHFDRTSEPEGPPAAAGRASRRPDGRLFVIQKHAAQRLHFDFRLEMDGVLKSWALPKGPSVNPRDHRLAVHVEDHPIDYGSFEGTIPKEEYGGGTVMLWDRGRWEPQGDPHEGYRNGKLKFKLEGKRLHGDWALVRIRGRNGDHNKNWLLTKSGHETATVREPVQKFTTSVATHRTMEDIAENARPVSKKAERGGLKPRISKADKMIARPASKASKTSPMPKEFYPQLATLVDDVPVGDNWIHETKFDGYRILCFIENGKARLMTRNGKDWTDKFSVVAKAAERLPIRHAIIDGEIVVKNPDGTTDFQSLQNYLRGQDKKPLIYEVFDLPYLYKYDLTKIPLLKRKELLKKLVEVAGEKISPTIQFSDHVTGKGKEAFQNACDHALEGIISKRADSPYIQDRTDWWVKVKCVKEQEFVIGGFTEPKGTRLHFGSLLLGAYDSKGKLIYCGHVGTGFNTEVLGEIYKELKKREQDKSPFANPIEDKLRRRVHWVRPALVAQVEFTGWTNDGLLRHPSFTGLREDKDASEVHIERPKHIDAILETKKNSSGVEASSLEGEDRIEGVRLTHADRILYPEQDVTKRDLAAYYANVADWILPHLRGRPIVLVRCPRGHATTCFYQKHVFDAPTHLRSVSIQEKSKQGKYLIIDDLKGLISLVQMAVLEIHIWGSTEEELEKPDRLVIDLDPGPDVPWGHVVQAANRLKERLEALELQSFVKTTGGKGLHVVAPLVPDFDWNELKLLTKTLAENLTKDRPDEYLAKSAKASRPGKIFIDYLRNSRGATSVCPYSTRAKKQAPVSTPLRWDELSPTLHPMDFTIDTLPKRLAGLKKDPWEGFFELKQRIPSRAAKRLGR